MFALGCIQSQSCHTNHCPTGVATQDPLRQRALVVPDKAERVRELPPQHAARAGARCWPPPASITRPSWRPHHLVRRVSSTEVKLFSQLHYFVGEGELLNGGESLSEFYKASWAMAHADSFDPLGA